MTELHLKPVAGLTVRDPETLQPLAEQDGDVTEVQAAPRKGTPS